VVERTRFVAVVERTRFVAVVEQNDFNYLNNTGTAVHNDHSGLPDRERKASHGHGKEQFLGSDLPGKANEG
jgi:hypothetical protein